MPENSQLVFINLEDDIKGNFDGEALNEANRNMKDFFLLVFSEARHIAYDRGRTEAKVLINSSNWLEGYWTTVASFRLRKRYPIWLFICRFALFLLPLWVGYALSDPKSLYWQIIIGGILSAVVFVLSEKLEDK